VLYISSEVRDEPDLAFLEFDPTHLPPAPPLGDDRLLGPQEFLAAIGYPAWNTNNNVDDMRRIFPGGFDVKRLAPGWVKQLQPVMIFTHGSERAVAEKW
jgi:hypothetical protein